MQHPLTLYNTLTRKKEHFIPNHAPWVGMYVCGPTVYGKAHLGHARSAICFDVLFRYLQHLGYQVRYVRNITDVGHLASDADEGEDKVTQQARLQQITPMEVAQYYTNSYRHDMAALNVRPPSIEPPASGHIPEQIAMIERMLAAQLAYVVNGSVYFDTVAYHQQHHYGQLSGRKIEDLLTNTRSLVAQHEKRNPLDFALWKKATPRHLMRWSSPWSIGFPGWHIECTALATHYLGQPIDIHGGGIDLLFPHHECELAQARAVGNTPLATYWVHNNVITVQGQKMGKSLGNAITLEQLFTGDHTVLDQAYSPMTLRFFMLQAHYRSTVDFSTPALQAAQQGYYKLMNGLKTLNQLQYVPDSTIAGCTHTAQQLQQDCASCYEALNDDLNTAQVIATLFRLRKLIQALQNGQLQTATVGYAAFEQLKSTYTTCIKDLLGLQEESKLPPALIDELLRVYQHAKTRKDYDQVTALRALLQRWGIRVQDTPTGVEWGYGNT